MKNALIIIVVLALILGSVLLMRRINRGETKKAKDARAREALGMTHKEFADIFRPAWVSKWNASQDDWYSWTGDNATSNDREKEAWVKTQYINDEGVRKKDGAAARAMLEKWKTEGKKNIKNPIDAYSTFSFWINGELTKMDALFSDPEVKEALKLV